MLGKDDCFANSDARGAPPWVQSGPNGNVVERVHRARSKATRPSLLKGVFVDGDEVCVIYDFVTDSPTGALPTVEWLRFEEGRISMINVYYDRLPGRR
jgi:hypothetical protein